MKKFICVLSIVCCGVLFVGCGSNKKATTNFNNHLIEVRNNLFAGQDEVYYATFCTGEREKDYALDGVVNDLMPFGIITLSQLDNTMLSADEYKFTLVINGENVTGVLEKSPYDNTYSADIEQNVADDAEIALQLVIDGNNFNQSLVNVSKDFNVNKDRALNIAMETLKDSIKDLSTEKNNCSEAFIKILKDYSGESNRYFWYVGIISPEGKTAGVLIDANNGEVISKKL